MTCKRALAVNFAGGTRNQAAGPAAPVTRMATPKASADRRRRALRMLIGLIVGAELELNVAVRGKGTIRGECVGVAPAMPMPGSGTARTNSPSVCVSGFTAEPFL